MMPKKEETITWLQINNWVPIITSAVMVALAFGAINTRLSLIEQKVEGIAASQTQMLDLFKSVENRYGVLSLQVKELEVKMDEINK